MARWEYKVFENNMRYEYKLSEHDLNQEGIDGWELVTAIPIVEVDDIDIYEGTGRGGGGETKRIRYIFKRRFNSNDDSRSRRDL